jgi:hypothetical protein
VTVVFDRCLSIGSAGLTKWEIQSKKENFSKRSMYGRAGFALLRIRVLSFAQKELRTQETETRSANEHQKRRAQKLSSGGENTPIAQIARFRVSEGA